jgi:hypothetical protein
MFMVVSLFFRARLFCLLYFLDNTIIYSLNNTLTTSGATMTRYGFVGPVKQEILILILT